jgi:hypothetical protein
MRKVLKYSLVSATTVEGNYAIHMPRGATVLTIQLQRGEPMMWALVDPDAPLVMREFAVQGTGWDIEDDSLAYVGTYQQYGGEFVWHLFEVPSSAVALP